MRINSLHHPSIHTLTQISPNPPPPPFPVDIHRAILRLYLDIKCCRVATNYREVIRGEQYIPYMSLNARYWCDMDFSSSLSMLFNFVSRGEIYGTYTRETPIRDTIPNSMICTYRKWSPVVYGMRIDKLKTQPDVYDGRANVNKKEMCIYNDCRDSASPI